jgi:hypothetical protein
MHDGLDVLCVIFRLAPPSGQLTALSVLRRNAVGRDRGLFDIFVERTLPPPPYGKGNTGQIIPLETGSPQDAACRPEIQQDQRYQMKKMIILTSLLIAGAIALNAAEKRATAGEPDITKLSVAEINKAQPPPEELFAVPFPPEVPVPSSKIWGGMFLWWHDGTYYMTHDCWNNPLPLYLLTSKDGVHLRPPSNVTRTSRCRSIC